MWGDKDREAWNGPGLDLFTPESASATKLDHLETGKGTGWLKITLGAERVAWPRIVGNSGWGKITPRPVSTLWSTALQQWDEPTLCGQ